MDRRFGVLILAILGAIVVGYGAFQAGLQQGVLAAGQGAAVVAPYAYGHHYGFGPLGFLFPLLFFFLIFGLIRAAFWRGPRWRGPRGDWQGGPGGDHRGGPRTMFEEWHREAHTDRPRNGSGATQA